MRLTTVLNIYKKMRHIPGTIYTGKNRIIPEITHLKKVVSLNAMLAEKRNIELLSTPWLSEEEDTLFLQTHQPWKKDLEAKKLADKKNFLKHETMEKNIEHTKVAQSWE